MAYLLFELLDFCENLNLFFQISKPGIKYGKCNSFQNVNCDSSPCLHKCWPRSQKCPRAKHVLVIFSVSRIIPVIIPNGFGEKWGKISVGEIPVDKKGKKPKVKGPDKSWIDSIKELSLTQYILLVIMVLSFAALTDVLYNVHIDRKRNDQFLSFWF